MRISASTSLYLEHDRDSQKTVCFEVANSLTGNLIAFGSISMDAVQQELLARSLNQTGSNSTVMTVNLESAAGAKQWGRVQCRLDASALQVWLVVSIVQNACFFLYVVRIRTTLPSIISTIRYSET